jgi:(2Fe-2S) ferredoxin
MGSVTAIGLADSVLDLETQLAYHLQGNHYPPVPLSMVQPCIEAIDAYYEDDPMRYIAMPEGVFYKGMSHAPAYAIIEQHHLDPWLPQDDEYYNEDNGFELGLGLE